MNELYELNELLGLLKSVAIPVVSALGGWVLIYIKKYIKRTLEMAEATNELNYLQKMNEVRDQILKEIEKTVKSVVASNMDLAKRMKEDLGYLTDDQIKKLNATAMEMIMASLPASLTQADGTLLNVIGGFDKLDVIIRNYMEQYVYEYKGQKKECRDTKDEPETKDTPAPETKPTTATDLYNQYFKN